VTVRGYDELRTMPMPDLWQKICRRLDQSPAAARQLEDGASAAAMRAAADDSAPRAALPRTDRRGAPEGSVRPRWAAMLAAAVAVLAVAAGLAIAGRLHARPERGPGRVVLFPGGGRLLFADAHGLKWLYPDGKTVGFAPGFIGASMTAGGTKLLAWRPTQNPRARPPCAGCFADVDYYLMNLDGSGRRLVLRAEPTRGNIQPAHLDVQASPDGTRLAYIRQGQSTSTGRTLYDQLWTVSLVTGRRTDLGPAASSDSAVAWISGHALIAESADGAALRLVNLDTGHTTIYLTISDRRIIRAYEHARPGAGPPAAIEPIGENAGPGPRVFAVRLWGGTRRHPTDAAVALAGRRRILSYAPSRDPLVELTWGPDGIFLLHTSLGDNPCCAATFAGTTNSARAHRQPTYLGEAWDAAAFSPAGNVIALNYGYGNGATAFIPLTPPVCDRTIRCLHFRPTDPLPGLGSLQAWAPWHAMPADAPPS
jgi:hypothetical protein